MVDAIKTAFRIGISLDQFWRMTPWQLKIAVESFIETLKGEHHGRAWLAHTTALLTRVDAKHFPKLDQLTGDENKSSKKIDEDAIKRRMQLYREEFARGNGS